jgi:hypothetical protein
LIEAIISSLSAGDACIASTNPLHRLSVCCGFAFSVLSREPASDAVGDDREIRPKEPM